MNDPANSTGGKNVGGFEAPTMFGFTAAAMKTTLFSRMSPQAKTGAGTFNEASKIVRTQGSTNNMATTSMSVGASMTSPAVSRQTSSIPAN
jgi:hypothetical protein